MEYNNEKQVIVAKVVSDNPKAPTLRVTVEIDGQKYRAGVWPWERKDKSIVKDKNGNTLYKGTLELDDYVPAGTEPPPAQPTPPRAAPEMDEDDIPF